MVRDARVAFFALAALLLSHGISSAGDGGLYDAPIPADKSLVRFVNVQLKSGAVLDLSGNLIEVEPVAMSNYRIVANGDYTITDGQDSAEVKLEAGKYYTVAFGVNPGGIVVIADKDVENPSKSSLSIYNFSSGLTNLALKLNGDSKILFKDIVPAAMASKELPVIDIGLEVTAGDKKVVEFENVSLNAKQRQNVVIVDSANGLTGFLLPTGIDQ